MTTIHERILQIFKEFRSPKNSVLNPQSVNITLRKWDLPDQKLAGPAIPELIDEGLLGTKENWYMLLEKGYNYIYANYTVEQTEDGILRFLTERKLDVGHIIHPNWFLGLQRNLDEYPVDHFNEAFSNLETKGIIARKEHMFVLTEKSYEEIWK